MAGQHTAQDSRKVRLSDPVDTTGETVTGVNWCRQLHFKIIITGKTLMRLNSNIETRNSQSAGGGKNQISNDKNLSIETSFLRFIVCAKF
jgi:hypothetical protein